MFVHRAVDVPSPELLHVLQSLEGEPIITAKSLAPHIAANVDFLDEATASMAPTPSPSTNARLAVPLLLQLVRDWSEEGEEVRSQSYARLIAPLRPFRAPRVLLPGSGLGRLAFDIVVAHAGAHVVAVEADAASHVIAAHLMTPAECTHAGRTIYPAIHLGPNWASASHRLRGVRVPDVSREMLLHVQETGNISLVVGSFPDALPHLASDEMGRAFDAVVTSFFIDVPVDTLGMLRAIRAALTPQGGVWVNFGPLAFPQEYAEDGVRAFPLPYAQLRHLILYAGFRFLAEESHPCEYNRVPEWLERTTRTCYFFVAEPLSEPKYSKTF
ncbi:hypothetical protein AB1Y20_008620 [Prymnesium parvum]|uniref:carnosine N-methyltransferase n=1 Tax=Prymnesium parvum TaxID=97485 RepID=A0AB34ITL0_PRYPA